MADINHQPVRIVEMRPQRLDIDQRRIAHRLLIQPGLRFVGIVENLDVGATKVCEIQALHVTHWLLGNDSNPLVVGGARENLTSSTPRRGSGLPSG